MPGTSFRRASLPGIAALTCLAFAGIAGACPFCSMQGQTLTGDVNQASMVLFGTLANAKLDANGAFGQGSTDLRIEAVIIKKPNPGGSKSHHTSPIRAHGQQLDQVPDFLRRL